SAESFVANVATSTNAWRRSFRQVRESRRATRVSRVPHRYVMNCLTKLRAQPGGAIKAVQQVVSRRQESQNRGPQSAPTHARPVQAQVHRASTRLAQAAAFRA